MSQLKRVKRSTRALFNKPYYKFEVQLTVLENNYIFVGSARDELAKVPDSVYEEKIDLDKKLEKIADLIKPMSSIILIEDEPYIPGSTLKGMIRFRVEHSFKPDKNGKIYSCFIKQAHPEIKENIKNFLIKFGYFPNEVEARQNEDIRSDQFCKVCDLFGNSNLASRVIISDAKPLNEIKLEELNISEKWNDIRRVIPPKSQFKFTINLNNGDMEDLALLYLGMNLHNDGTLLLGMNKFAPKKNDKGQIIHFGRIKLELIKILEFSNDKKGFSEKEISTSEEINNFNEKILNEIKKFEDQLRNFSETSE